MLGDLMLVQAPPSDWKVGTVRQYASPAKPNRKKKIIERAGRGYQKLISKDNYFGELHLVRVEIVTGNRKLPLLSINNTFFDAAFRY